MPDTPDLLELARPFPTDFVERKDGQDYVAHHVVNQRLLSIVGPFDFELVQVIRGDVAAVKGDPSARSRRGREGTPALHNIVVGGIWRLSATVDGRQVRIEEVGDVGDVHNWTHDDADWPAVRKHTWYLSGKYPQVSIQGRKVRLHRFLMGEPPEAGLEVDHRNRRPLDNRRSNLRWATRLNNRGNTDAHRGRSGYRGVYWDQGKWSAQACRNYQRHNLGRFEREEDAAEAVRQFWAGVNAEG